MDLILKSDLMKIALISDLHANSVALEAFIREIPRQGITQVVCLGDTISLGPDPVRTLRLLQEKAWPCIQGNHDEYLLRPERIEELVKSPLLVAAEKWCLNRLSAEDLKFIRSFKKSHEIQAGSLKLMMFHGSPSSNCEDVQPEASEERLDQQLGSTPGDILVFGHTHIQSARRHRDRWVVNPGSLGLPFRGHPTGGAPVLLPFAEYAIIEVDSAGIPSVALRRIPLDRESLLHSARESGDFPLKDYLVQEWSRH